MDDKLTILMRHVGVEKHLSLSRSARELLGVALTEHGVHLSGEELLLPYPQLSELLGTSGNHVSIAHTKGLVAVALGTSQVGIDVEPVDQIRKWHAMAQLFFTPQEASQIARAPAFRQRELFLEYWVTKEAFIKTIQGSVFGDLNKISHRGGASGWQCQTPNEEGELWWLWRARHRGYLFGLCTNASSKPQLRMLVEPGINAGEAAKQNSIRWEELDIVVIPK